MDFGFGTLIDKIEERIGSTLTTGLLWLVAIAAFVLCLKTIITEAIIPTTKFIMGMDARITQSSALGFLVSVGTAVVSALVFSIVFRWLTKKRVQRIIDESRQMLDITKARSEEITTRAERIVAEAQDAVSEAQKLMAAHKLLSERLTSMSSSIDDGREESQ